MIDRAHTAYALHAADKRKPAASITVAGALLLGLLWLGGCGGGEGDSPSLAALHDVAASSLSTVLDADGIASIDDAAQQAAQARGAPGEAEQVAYTVHARRREDAVRVAAALEARGFVPVRVLEQALSAPLGAARAADVPQ
ncbi:hypothetical protein BH11PSE8_BH11PSE8_28390 [soil metagenome]